MPPDGNSVALHPRLEWLALCKRKWKKWVSRTKEWLLCAGFTVQPVRGSFPPLKTLKGSKGLRRTEIGQ
jgi:hypothetical protein